MGTPQRHIRLTREDFLILLWHASVARSLDERAPAPENWELYLLERDVIWQRYYDMEGGVKRLGAALGMAYVVGLVRR